MRPVGKHVRGCRDLHRGEALCVLQLCRYDRQPGGASCRWSSSLFLPCSRRACRGRGWAVEPDAVSAASWPVGDGALTCAKYLCSEQPPGRGPGHTPARMLSDRRFSGQLAGKLTPPPTPEAAPSRPNLSLSAGGKIVPVLPKPSVRPATASKCRPELSETVFSFRPFLTQAFPRPSPRGLGPVLGDPHSQTQRLSGQVSTVCLKEATQPPRMKGTQRRVWWSLGGRRTLLFTSPETTAVSQAQNAGPQRAPTSPRYRGNWSPAAPAE